VSYLVLNHLHHLTNYRPYVETLGGFCSSKNPKSLNHNAQQNYVKSINNPNNFYIILY